MNTKKVHILRIHLGLFFAEAICLSAFILELSRALSGNELSWAYVIEWPVLGAYALYMWRKLLREERFGDAPVTPESAVEDPRLRAWNEYLTRVHAHDQTQK